MKSLESGNVRFMVKDYRQGGKKSVLALSDGEFIRRFSLHILPKGFTRIRHYGILSSYYKRTLIPELQKDLGRPELAEKVPLKHRKCPSCKKGNLVTIATFPARGPPNGWREQIEKHLNRPI
ncbi:transposase [Oceanihabitans sp. IOP_32]|uniref:transposase n=1 Tax=Oceanihabitans sp. IOP_32 TaxID=2529032 RepID=UPI0021049F46|nr:transposase [Oceanihabitans sp. IOP_32]